MRSIPPRTLRTLMSVALMSAMLVLLAFATGCESEQRPAERPIMERGEYEPAAWGEKYPVEYEQWLATQEQRPAGKSPYKRGFDGGVMFDKLSEFPFMAVLFKGWGFGIEYNEPRGHYYMLIDQQEIDPARVKAGGGCITCKSPYAEELHARDKKKLFSATYDEAIAMLPEEHRRLGATCIDCHDPETMALATRRWTAASALDEIGVTVATMKKTDQRIMVCGQCHATYSVMKEDGKSVDIDFPWEGAKWGGLTIEQMIKNLEEQDGRHEWVQQVTGMKLGFIRHPDVEFYAMEGSPHFDSGTTCADCHMPPTGSADGANHNIMSPLKADMVACRQCHTDTAAEMRAKVIGIQQASLAQMIDVGYRVAEVARLFEIANRSLNTTSGDAAYDEAAKHYREAFYRLNYMGAENSVGFHNPPEAARMLTDAKNEAALAEKGLRKLLTTKRVKAPRDVDLELPKYLNDRGVRKLDFNRRHYIADPTGQAEKTQPSLGRLLK